MAETRLLHPLGELIRALNKEDNLDILRTVRVKLIEELDARIEAVELQKAAQQQVQPKKPDGFTCTVISMSGEAKDFEDLSPLDSFASFVERVMDEFDMDGDQMHLCFGTKHFTEVDESKTLQDLKIQEGSELTMYMKVHHDLKPETSQKPRMTHRMTVTAEPDETF